MHTQIKRTSVPLCLAFAAGSAFAQPAPASFPAKPVRVIVPFAPGGPNDIFMRLLGPKMGELWSQAVVIENRPGGAATTGMEVVVRSQPDGYTLGIGNNTSLIIGPLLQPKVGYDPVKDLVPLGSVALTPYVVAINPGVPAKGIGDVIRLARARPGFLSYASSGAGTVGHLAAEMLLGTTGTKMLHVPYRGAGPALTAMISGESDLGFVALSAAEPFVRAGKLRVIAAVGVTRSSFAPELPTLIEQGLKVPAIEGRYGLVAPVGISREAAQRIYTTMVAAVKSDDLSKRMIAQGFEPAIETPEQYGVSIRREIEVFGKVIRNAGIKVDG